MTYLNNHLDGCSGWKKNNSNVKNQSLSERTSNATVCLSVCHQLPSLVEGQMALTKQYFWWVKCKWIISIWIKFPLIHLDLKIKRKMLGKANFDFCQAQALEKLLEMFNNPTEENLAHFLSPFYRIWICSHTRSPRSPQRHFDWRWRQLLNKPFLRKALVYSRFCQAFRVHN